MIDRLMTRIHSHRRGKAQSTRPPSGRLASWTSYTPEEVTTLIVRLGKEGLSSSEVGLRLRDEYGIPLVRPIAGRKMSEVLREGGIERALPEDLNNLLIRAKGLQEHLKVHTADRKNVRSLELLEAKVHQLSKYYKREGKLPPTWKYSAVVAQLS